MSKPKFDFNEKPLGYITCKLVGRSHYPSAGKAAVSVLLDRMRWSDFRCYPSLADIERLCGYARSNIQSGLKVIEEDGILIIHQHGGRYGTNSYEFCWDEILRRDEEFQAALFPGRRSPRKQGEQRSVSRAQTRSPPKKSPEQTSAPNEDLPESKARNGQPRKYGGRREPYVPKRQSATDANEAAAERRWNNELLERFKDSPSVYAVIIDVIDPETQTAATEAEMKRRGSGLYVILDHVRKVRPTLI